MRTTFVHCDSHSSDFKPEGNSYPCDEAYLDVSYNGNDSHSRDFKPEADLCVVLYESEMLATASNSHVLEFIALASIAVYLARAVWLRIPMVCCCICPQV